MTAEQPKGISSELEWQFNQYVVVATNHGDITAMTKNRRWNLKAKKLADVPQPTIFVSYSVLIWKVSTPFTGFCLTSHL